MAEGAGSARESGWLPAGRGWSGRGRGLSGSVRAVETTSVKVGRRGEWLAPIVCYH
eukprot:COSAG02_NODE_451_length_22060_cov_6.853513_6_plen_56_part_00